MSAKAGLDSQIMFALGVIIILVAIGGYFTSSLRPLFALGVGLLGLIFSFGAWRRMHR